MQTKLNLQGQFTRQMKKKSFFFLFSSATVLAWNLINDVHMLLQCGNPTPVLQQEQGVCGRQEVQNIKLKPPVEMFLSLYKRSEKVEKSTKRRGGF